MWVESSTSLGRAEMESGSRVGQSVPDYPNGEKIIESGEWDTDNANEGEGRYYQISFGTNGGALSKAGTRSDT